MLYRCVGSPVRDARRAPSRALFQTPPRGDRARPAPTSRGSDPERRVARLHRDPSRSRGSDTPAFPLPSTRGAPVLLAPRRSDRDAPTLTSPISLPRFRRGRRTLNYGQPALTDAANKVNAQ